MSYANGRRIVDADSHLMEPPDFLTVHASVRVRDALPRIGGGLSGLAVERREHSREEYDALVALGDDLVRRGPKWYAALGAVDPNERGKALDLLGFEHQVIYSSLCATVFDIADPSLRYAAYRAHNEGMAEFCSADRRLLGVALCDLDDAEQSRAALEHALSLGLKLVWIPARAPAKVSPGHNQHDWFWATLAERRVPFVLHVGSGPLPIAPEWTINGRAPPERAPVAEVITSKDLMVVYQPVERFLSVLVLDGVLERHPALRGGAIEMGAGWVPAMLRRLDHAVDIWSKSEVELRQMTRKPSEQASAQLRFTPYPFEDVGQLCRESDPGLYLFSSDYPHAEGGRDPIGRFSRSLAGQDERTQQAFFAENAREWLGLSQKGSDPF
jgi:predicted TIM-barrel fold metal-dependent hydrolase